MGVRALIAGILYLLILVNAQDNSTLKSPGLGLVDIPPCGVSRAFALLERLLTHLIR